MNPRAAISSRNFPRPQYGTTFATTNVTIINNNYRYDAAHYGVHVNRFYGWQSPGWGGHWRWGFAPSVSFGVSFGGGFGFGFGYYAYSPFYTPVVVSPWYYNPYVPAYIPETRVVVWSGYSVGWSDGDAYAYYPNQAWNGYGDPQLNYSIADLHDCYVNNDPNAIADVMGDGQIAVWSRGRYQYSLQASDFQGMMADNCRACHTTSFEVVRVRHHGPWAWVHCRQQYLDQSGYPRTVYMVYRMNRVGDRYAIVDFMTSDTVM